MTHSKMYSHEIETDEQLCQFIDHLDTFDYDEIEIPVALVLRPHNKRVTVAQDEHETIWF